MSLHQASLLQILTVREPKKVKTMAMQKIVNSLTKHFMFETDISEIKLYSIHVCLSSKYSSRSEALIRADHHSNYVLG